MPSNKIDSNVSALHFAEEDSLKVLPGSPVWYELEANSYSELGGQNVLTARNPFNASRQKKRGRITDLDASGGMNVDKTQNNMTRLQQGFMFADAREKASSMPLNGTAVALTNVDGTGEQFQAASGLDVFKAGDLILASDMGLIANNGLHHVTAAAAGAVTVDSDLSDETPGASAKIQVVGFQFQTAECNITATATSFTLTASTTDCTTLGLTPGEFVFIGGDAAANKFVNNEPGYARIASIVAGGITFDESTFVPVAETGTGLDIQIFFGVVERNEKQSSLIKRRSYNVERQLGNDDDGVQSEYLIGAIANELTLNIPATEKLTTDISFVAMDDVKRTGLEGLKSGTRVPADGEDFFSASSDVYRLKLYVYDETTMNPAALFAFVNSATISINNNVSPNKAVAVLGSFDATAGDFEVGGEINAYFSTVEAVKAVRNNADAGFNIICAANNAGFVYDIPLLGLGNGRLNVEKDNPITIPLETMAAECANGYTLMYCNFPYLPDAAMPA